MNSLIVSLCVFTAVLIAGVAGITIRNRLQPHHLNDETKDIGKFGSGFIATMAARVLGLLVASAKSSYDAKVAEVEQVLREYGQDAASTRQVLQAVFTERYRMTWVNAESLGVAEGGPVSSAGRVSEFRRAVAALDAGNDAQRAVQARALQIIDDLGQARWLFTVQSTESASVPLLLVLVTWLCVIALCTALYAPRNGIAATVAVLCAASVSGAVFLIVEMYSPFDGFLRVSDAPFRAALGYLKQ